MASEKLYRNTLNADARYASLVMRWRGIYVARGFYIEQRNRYANRQTDRQLASEQARFFRASAHIVKSSVSILNFLGSGRLERESSTEGVNDSQEEG